MRTLVLSDLHLGCGADPGIFAGASVLVEVLHRLGARPLRVVLNGDTFDFLAQDAAGDVAYALTQDPRNTAVLAALGRVLKRGGELILRSGRHDGELGLAAVQAHVLRGLQASQGAGGRVSFHAADASTRCIVGGARVLVVHTLRGGGAVSGRELADNLLNPLRRQFGVGLADLLRSHPVGAALAALAVNPTAVKHVLCDLTSDVEAILGGLRRSPEFARASLSEREAEALARTLAPDVVLGAEAHDGALRRARVKLLRASLGDAGAGAPHPRDLTDDEWQAARTLARSKGATTVLAGSTHQVGWRAGEGLIVCDTGAWTWLAEVPPPSSDDEAWAGYLERWQRTPRIDAHLSGPAPTQRRFTGALIEPRAAGRGARVALIDWTASEPTVLREQLVPAARNP